VTVIRHTALFVWAEGVTAEQKLRAKEGVAYCWFGSDVLTFDFGEDLGVAPARHGFSLQHDHQDRASWDAYNENVAHARAGAFLKSLTRPELAARVDWTYDGPSPRRGTVRHLALYRWAEGAGNSERSRALAAVADLRERCPSLRALETGVDLGWYPPNYDWIAEAHFDTVEGLSAFMEHPAQLEAAAALEAATAELARVQYRVLGG
jgi:Stress responsive A/B Barrel Domain